MHTKVIHTETHGAYGWPRTWQELRARGVRVGKERVRKLMHLHGIRAKGKRRFKVTTDSNHDLPIAANLLDREFSVVEPDRVWTGDITYIATNEGWLFLAVVIDLFSRKVVGWALRDDMMRDIGGCQVSCRRSELIQALFRTYTGSSLCGVSGLR